MNYTIMSSAWQLPLYFAPSNIIFSTSELFKLQSSQPYICTQKVECALSKVSLLQMLKSLITHCLFDKNQTHCL